MVAVAPSYKRLLSMIMSLQMLRRIKNSPKVSSKCRHKIELVKNIMQ